MGDPVKTLYTDMGIRFTLEGVHIHALHIVFERFTRALPSHSHGSGCYELHYISEGYGKLVANGRHYDIRPNTLFVTGPHVEHAQTPVWEEPMQEYCIYLKVCGAPRPGKNSPVMDLFTATPFWIGADAQGIHPLMKQLFEELDRRYIGYQEKAGLLLAQLLIGTARNYERRPSQAAVSRSGLSALKPVIIEEYFLYEYNALSLEGLAGRLGLSPRQTQRLLMEYYGKPFQQKKAEARMAAAALLLAQGEGRIAWVAEALGYCSAEHFSSAFKKYYGKSPREYRRQLFQQAPGDAGYG